MRILAIFIILTSISGCYARVGPECEGLEQATGYELPITEAQLRRIQTRGLDECADFIVRNGMVEIE
jgi:hypothetical protein